MCFYEAQLQSKEWYVQRQEVGPLDALLASAHCGIISDYLQKLMAERGKHIPQDLFISLTKQLPRGAFVGSTLTLYSDWQADCQGGEDIQVSIVDVGLKGWSVESGHVGRAATAVFFDNPDLGKKIIVFTDDKAIRQIVDITIDRACLRKDCANGANCAMKRTS